MMRQPLKFKIAYIIDREFNKYILSTECYTIPSFLSIIKNDLGSISFSNGSFISNNYLDIEKCIWLRQFSHSDRTRKRLYEGDVVQHYVDFGPGGDVWGYYSMLYMTDAGINLQYWMFESENKEWALPYKIGNVFEDISLLDKVPDDNLERFIEMIKLPTNKTELKL